MAQLPAVFQRQLDDAVPLRQALLQA